MTKRVKLSTVSLQGLWEPLTTTSTTWTSEEAFINFLRLWAFVLNLGHQMLTFGTESRMLFLPVSCWLGVRGKRVTRSQPIKSSFTNYSRWESLDSLSSSQLHCEIICTQEAKVKGKEEDKAAYTGLIL